MTESSSPHIQGPYSGFGHGKVILLGEHAAVFGQPALAAGLKAGISVTAQTGTGRIESVDGKISASLGDGSVVARAAAALIDDAMEGAPPPAIDLQIESALPYGAGLGSSAALAVASARALFSFLGQTASAERITQAAGCAEHVFHGSASGIDVAAAVHGGFGRFTKETGWQPVAARQGIKLCVGLTGKTRPTFEMVLKVQALCGRSAPAQRLIELLGHTTEAGIAALERGDIDELGRSLDMAHGMLAGLRVSSWELEQLVHGARASGAIGAKLTGAGGGGAAIALAPSHRQDVLNRWRADGFEGFVTHIAPA